MKDCERIRYTQPIQEASTNEEPHDAAKQLEWTPWIVQGRPLAKMTAHDDQQDFGWEFAYSLRVEPASSRRQHSIARYVE